MISDALNESRELRFWGKLLVDDIVRQICFLTLLHAVLRLCSLVCWLYTRYIILRKNILLIYSQHICYLQPAYTYMCGRGSVRGSRENLDSECKGVIDCSNLVGEAVR